MNELYSALFRRARSALVGLLALLSVACASYSPEPLEACQEECDIYSEDKHGVAVSTRLLSDDQARRLYGVDLASVGLQAIWLRIDNRNDHSHWLLVSALDPNYFAPGEAAALFDVGLSEADELRAYQRFSELAVPLKSPPGMMTEGYVLAPRHEGGRYLAVMLMGNQHAVEFGFAVKLRDGEF